MMSWFNRLMNWLASREQYHHPKRNIGPDTCPRCGTPPYPAGACLACGWALPPPQKHKVFSSNNLPAIIFVIFVWGMALASALALLIR